MSPNSIDGHMREPGAAAAEARYARLDGMSTQEKLGWLLRFTKTNLQQLSRAERIALAEDLRALVKTIGIGWSWRDRRPPLGDRVLRSVQTHIGAGLKALNEVVRSPRLTTSEARKVLTKKRAQESFAGAGWRLPPHRVVFRPLPRQTDDPTERPIIATIYEARDEQTAIIAAVGQFLVQERRRWRTCPCGCGEYYVPTGKQIYFAPACENRLRARRRRDEQRKERELRNS